MSNAPRTRTRRRLTLFFFLLVRKYLHGLEFDDRRLQIGCEVVEADIFGFLKGERAVANSRGRRERDRKRSQGL